MVLFGFGDREALRILIYEHVSSGGYSGESIPPSLLCEGYAMLRGLTEDFKASGYEVTVLLDARIAALHPPLNADCIVKIAGQEEADSSMDTAAKDADAVYVVAPEYNHVLKSIVEGIEARGPLSLNVQSLAIDRAADKSSLGVRAKSLGLNFPKTKTCSVIDVPENVAELIDDELGFPVVIKPSKGASCCGLSVVKTHKDVAGALAKVRSESTGDQAYIQEYVGGVPVSVSLVCTGAEALPVSLNLQEIILAGPNAVSSYDGGTIPFKHPLGVEAFSSAKSLVESFEGGLHGYVGVDFVLSEDKATVIEVNPRLTTSYVGLRRVARFNVAQSILKALSKNELPKKSQTKGYACFSKLAIHRPETYACLDLWESSVIASPPFPLTENGGSYALVQSYGKTSAEASYGVSEAKKRLLQINNGAE